MLTHFIDFDAPGQRIARALCGTIVARREHVNDPTCDRCRRVLASRPADDSTVEDVFGTDDEIRAYGPPVTSSLSNPTHGYRLKGDR